MKKVILKSITLRNFRGEKERTTNFNDVETTIMGENGLGKSRHFDAFVWLLFGKDTKDRKDFNIKTLADGKPLERVNCEVSCVLDVNGETINLRRVYAEKWVKPRGQVEGRFDGHEHELYWNDVPLKVGEYQARINSIINDSVFKMITNPMFFAGMKWQDQREQLFQLAGTITDAEIGAKKPEFAALLDKITGKSFADFKREISARKKRLKEDLEQIQPRIDQTQKLMPEIVDFEALEAEIKDYEQQIADVDKAIIDKSEAIRQQYEAVQTKQCEINNLKQKQQKVLFDAQTQAHEDNFKANEKRREAENDIKVAESEIMTLQRAVDNNLQEAEGLKNRTRSKQEEADILRKQWYDENAKEYKENDMCLICPVFKINCTDNKALNYYAENKGKARTSFIEMKQAKLADITEKGKKLTDEVEKLDKEADKLVEKNDDLQKKITELTTNIKQLQIVLFKIPAADAKDIIAADLPEYAEFSMKIQTLEDEVRKMEPGEPADTAELRSKKTAVTDEINKRKNKLHNRALIAKYTQVIADLEAQGKNIAQQIADVECEEYTIQSFTKARIDECERRINDLFTMVTFKLFEYTIDGNESEICIPLVNGIPFGVANAAGQVNAGLDIINALVRFHGVSAPIFIDGRESVNHIIPTESQIINLVVSKDKELIIK